MKNALLALLLAPWLVACGSDVVNYSAPVPMAFKVQSKDASGTGYALVGITKNINSPSGNPFGAFVADAQRALGRAPSRIVATWATLEIQNTSTPPSLALDQVFAATPAVTMTFTPSTVPVTVCGVLAPSKTAVAMTPLFDSSNLSAGDYGIFLGASFPVTLNGNATQAFALANPAQTADLVVTVGFEAFK